MAGFTSLDDWINAVSALGQVNDATFNKIGTAPEAANTWYSYWKDGGSPAGGANPAAGSATPGAGGTAYDLTDGSITKWADVSTAERHLGVVEVVASVDCTMMIYDRLVGVGSLSVATTGNKDVGSAALPRYTDGVGVECWLEFSTASTATLGAADLISYTDQDGNTGQAGASKSFPAAATNIGAMAGPMPLAAGDYGVRAVQTLHVGTATTTGVVNLVLLKPLLYVPLVANLGTVVDLVSEIPSLPRIYDGATLAVAILATTTTVVTVAGHFTAAYL